jgi:hypothetical protein
MFDGFTAFGHRMSSPGIPERQIRHSGGKMKSLTDLTVSRIMSLTFTAFT